MNSDLYTYQVREELPPFDPTYGRFREIKNFGEDKAGAIAWAKAHYKERPNPEQVYVEERQYASRRNLERDLTLYTRRIWSGNY